MNNRFVKLLQDPKMTLIMSLPSNDPVLARAAWQNGADVLKVHINVEHRASKTTFYNFEREKDQLNIILAEAKGPCGIVLGGDVQSARNDFKHVVQAGFEFVSLYAHHTPIIVLQSESLSKMIAIDYSYTLDDIKAFNSIGIDVLESSIVEPQAYGQPLTAKDLLRYHNICCGTDIPVVVPTQKAILPEEVSALCQCGVAGIMLGAVVTGKTADSIARSVAEFRNQIDK